MALAAALYLCWLMRQPFVNVLLWASVLAVVFYPMHRRIRTLLESATAAAAVSTLLVLVLILFFHWEMSCGQHLRRATGTREVQTHATA